MRNRFIDRDEINAILDYNECTENLGQMKCFLSGISKINSEKLFLYIRYFNEMKRLRTKFYDIEQADISVNGPLNNMKKIDHQLGEECFFTNIFSLMQSHNEKKLKGEITDYLMYRNKVSVNWMNEYEFIHNWASVFKNAIPGFYSFLANEFHKNNIDPFLIDLCRVLEIWFYSEDKEVRAKAIHRFYQNYPQRIPAMELDGIQYFTEQNWLKTLERMRVCISENDTIYPHEFLMMLKDRSSQFIQIKKMISQQEQVSEISADRRAGHVTYVQAHIANFTFNQPVEYLNEDNFDNLTYLLTDGITTNWSVPRWARKGDIVLFQYSKKAVNNINRAKKEIQQSNNISERIKEIDSVLIEEIKSMYRFYGGKIVAIGRLDCDAIHIDGFNWPYTADIKDIVLLKNPLTCHSYTSFVRIQTNGITPLWGDHYGKIKEMILQANDNLPDYFINSVAMTKEQSEINTSNWIKKNIENQRHYHKEEEYRTFFIDYLLKEISDDYHFYSECSCYRRGADHPSFVDYVILLKDRWVPVEAKININIEQDLNGQVEKYCRLTRLSLDKETDADLSRTVNDHVLIIDEKVIQIYDDRKKERSTLFDLNRLQSRSDIVKLRKLLIERLS